MPTAVVHLPESEDDLPIPTAAKRAAGLRLVGTKADGTPQMLPEHLAASVWHGDELGSTVVATISSGFAALDAELPGGGWPCHAISEILQPQPTVTEWRLLAPALCRVMAQGRTVVIVGPPKHPHMPGLRFAGIDAERLIWIRTELPAQRLWVTEQLIKSNACGAIVAWLPQARQEQIRRLQVCAASCEGLTFLCRPAAAEHEASAAPLRVQVTFGADWELFVHVFKRRGAMHEGQVRLDSVPGGLASVLTPRLRRPSALRAHHADPSRREPADVLGSVVPAVVQRVAAH